MNVTVACLRGQRRRAPDAYITGAVLVCLVRSVTLATCVMWRRPCVLRNVSPALTLLLCQTTIKHCVGMATTTSWRKNTNPKRFELFFRLLGGWVSELETASRRGAITKMLFCFTTHKAASDSVWDKTDWCAAKSFES